MEVAIASPSSDFDFSGARTSPYLSAPSSPQRFGECYLSAPTSPSRISEFYREFDYFSSINGDSASIPFGWEEKPAATPKSSKLAVRNNDDDNDGFAFLVSQEADEESRSAEELFDGGKIKPLKPSTGLEVKEFVSVRRPLLSPKQKPRSPVAQGKKMIRDAFSPKKRESDPHAIEADETRNKAEQMRGRDRTPAAVPSSSSSGRRASRSHSPYRASHYTWDEEQDPQHQRKKEESLSSSNSGTASFSSMNTSSKNSRKWRLKDFLLFRSASEGRGTNKDPFRKYSVSYRKPEDSKASSFRSSENSITVAGTRRRGPVSAHEFHYAMKKAESEDLKKKTFLPYKQGILGRLAGLGSFTR